MVLLHKSFPIVLYALSVFSTLDAATLVKDEPKLQIVGGNQSDVDIPFMAALWSDTPNRTKEIICGGTVLSASYVLTAAHCVNGTDTHYIQFGARNLTDHENPHIDARNEASYVVHEDYRQVYKGIYVNDLAIVKLKKPLSLDFIKPVKLPSRRDVHKTYNNEVMTAYGWGIANSSVDYGSEVLMYVKLNVIDLQSCRKWAHFYNFSVPYQLMCLSTLNGKDTCGGDSGGPMISDNGTQVAVIQGGSGKCGDGKPSFATNLGYYLDWIEANSDVKIEN